MSSRSSHGKRHHHPVDSLCRKLQTINMMDQASNPALQIPKFQSKNFDSPQGNVKKNLEEILKKRTVKVSESNELAYDTNLLSPFNNNVFSPGPQTTTPRHRRISDIRSESISVSRNKERANKSWLLIGQAGGCSPCLFKYGESAASQLCGTSSTEQKAAPSREWDYLTSSPDLSAWELNTAQPVFQSPVSKSLSLGWRPSTENKDDVSSDVSLICEEDLLTTIFSACDIERRGRVAVSKLVDFLRHTTSRSSEDSSLEELCNMLDPDQRDISMDLETYHAIMKEWIEDCRRSWKEQPSRETTRESMLAGIRTHVRLNVTSGSLEALGGDVSRGDLETSDLITCVADLQFNNQKLQEENSQLKVALDAMEEANNRLTEDNVELRNQIKSFQQSVTQVKTLKEELEEAKNNLNTAEERRLRTAAQNKQLEKENQSLILKISSLQEENIRNALDSDGLQKKIMELSRNIAEFQMQVHLYEKTVENKDASLLKKDFDIQEMKSTLKEYTSVIETLRVEKNKLVNNVQQMQQELISNGLSHPLIYKFNTSILEGTNSLLSELELAQEQSAISGIEWAALDELLDREILLLLQGPEQMGEKFTATIQKLQEELSQQEQLVKLCVPQAEDSQANMQEAYEKKLADLRQDMVNKRALWIQKLDLLVVQKETLDKELVRMAGNLRRMRTEQLHLKKALSSRQHELELAKQLKEDSVSEGDTLRLALQEVTKQLEDASKGAKDQDNALYAACEEARSLQRKLEESIAEQTNLQTVNINLTRTCQVLELKAKEQSTAFDSLKEKHFKGLLCGVLCQICVNDDESPLSSSNVNEEIRTEEKKTCCYKRFSSQQNLLLGSSWSPTLRPWCLQYTSLLDALALDSLQLIWRSSVPRAPENTRILATCEEQHLRNGSILHVMLEGHKCNSHAVGSQTDAELVSSASMDADFTKRDAEPLTDVPSSSEQTAPQKTSSFTSECTNGSHGMDSTLLHNVEGKASQTALVLEEETAGKEEVKEETLNDMTGDSSSSEDLSSTAVCRVRQRDNISPSEKEVEAEFLRLSLGFKCDFFTLEKRVRLEERSRDLAEGNLRKEVASALKLLDSLASLSEDNQAQEIVKKLQKSLELLNQYAIRVASKAEMLGAIHQESRLSKAVEVMIRHVENLKRTYAREHAELEELKQALLQNERSFGSLGDRDESSIKKLPGSLKPSSLRRVSIATLPRNTGNAVTVLPLAQLNETDGSDKNDKFNRRSSWGLVGAKQGEKCPLLQRYVSSPSWTESEEEQPEPKNSPLEPPAPEARGSKARKLSEKKSNSSKWGLHSLCTRFFSWASSLRASICRANKTLCFSVVVVVFLAVLLTFILSLSFQRPAEAAPVGTGDAWTSVQQLLWPYTRLQHQGPPPV
ncbi:inositol 1,4,5-triphosphate receptor associated 2 isoform X2 [Rhineura floridana]|uniref:inositol 1,4,5-triphosphate receptor associated 2 isoform X2 n=1 Tax=Rhineura floridana TaxID=261503 RepID=UPI002AC869FB|nr:inositol 1,4,5-triphosphate receptor associated 2 isoform X2 [Rhineura floridana]